MRTGSVEVKGRIALFVEYEDRRTKRYEPGREVASESVADLLAEGVSPHAFGFRFFTKVVASVDTPLGPSELSSHHLETGPRHIIGERVNRAYLVALAPDGPVNIGTLSGLIARFDAEPGLMMARAGSDLFVTVMPGDVVVDPSGREVTETLGAPDGWKPVTEFAGCTFYLEVTETVLGVRTFGETAGEAVVHLNVSSPRPGLSAAIQASVRGQNAEVDPSRGILTLGPGANLCIPLDPARALLLVWNGKVLHAEISAS